MKLDGIKIHELGHDYLSKKLNLPDWYGRNLDGLYDCLCEMNLDIELINGQYVNDDLINTFKDASLENDYLSFKII